jgi:hypothetical protein
VWFIVWCLNSDQFSCAVVFSSNHSKTNGNQTEEAQGGSK